MSRNISAEFPPTSYRHVHLDCPTCGRLRLVEILARCRTRPRMTYRVRCPECGAEFTGSRPPDTWRMLRRVYGLTPSQVGKAKRYALATTICRLEEGSPPRSRVEAIEDVMRFAEALRDEESAPGN